MRPFLSILVPEKLTLNPFRNRNYVRQKPIADLLVRKLQTDFLDVCKATQLRREIRRQLQPAKVDHHEAEHLRRQIAALDKRMDTGTEKLLLAPADLTELLAGKLQQWRGERQDLQGRLETLQRPQEATGLNIDEMVNQAMGELATLRERLHEADPALLRETLREMVVKVELWFHRVPKRKTEKSELVRGLIHLRPESQFIKLVSGGSTFGKSHVTLNNPRSASG